MNRKDAVRIQCIAEEEIDSFLMEQDNKFVYLSDVPEEFKMDKAKLEWFIRLLNIRLQKIS